MPGWAAMIGSVIPAGCRKRPKPEMHEIRGVKIFSYCCFSPTNRIFPGRGGLQKKAAKIKDNFDKRSEILTVHTKGPSPCRERALIKKIYYNLLFSNPYHPYQARHVYAELLLF